MKKTKRIIALIAAVVMLFSAVELSQTVSAVSGAKTKKYSKEYSKNGTTYFKYSKKISVLTSKSTAAKKVNKYINKLIKKDLSAAESFAEEEFDKGYTAMMPYYLDYDIKLTYNKKGIYSFKCSKMLHQGGPHPSFVVSGLNFSKKTGKKISNSKLTKYSSATLKKKIVSKIKKEIEKTPSKYYNDALERVRKMKLSDFVFWLNGSKLHVYFNQYILSPWVAGPTEITIKLK